MSVKVSGVMVRTVVLSLFSASLLHARAYHFAGGTGEPNDPYQIATAEQLVSIGSDPNLLDKHFVLLNDIDLDPNLPGGRTFMKAVIAPSDGPYYSWRGVPFTGVFDGRGHSIRKLTFQRTVGYNILSFIALFGNVARGGMVSNLRVEGANLHKQNGTCVGVLAGWNEGRIVRCGASGTVPGSESVGVVAGYNRGEIIDCWAEGNVAGARDIGGLVGFNSYGIILNSHAACKVRSSSPIDFNCGGGLVGQNLYGGIVNCWATGDIWAHYPRVVGGLVGASFGGVIANSYATGNVSGAGGGERLGGLVGSTSGTINHCYASGNVSGSNSLGGLVGHGGFITDSYATGRVSMGGKNGGLVGDSPLETKGCFWNIETSGLATSDGGTGLTTAQMQDAATYLAAGWDLAGERENGTSDPWFIPQGGGYPLLTVHSDAFKPHKLDGTGTAEDPCRIATAEDLDAINHCDGGACYRLEADIDLGQRTRSEAWVRYFDGTFDGAGRVITGLNIQGGNNLGLFGDLGTHAAITHLGIRDANITGTNFLGTLAAMNRGSITACWANGAVTGAGDMGILAGWSDGNISDSYVTGSVLADADRVMGGLAGWNVGTISRCYAAARVSWLTSLVYVFPPTERPGSLVASNHEPPWSGVAFTKGLEDVSGAIHSSYLLIDTDGGGPDNGLGTALTGIQMKQQASFPGWDFDATWTICENESYPRLQWENAAGRE